jgi:predicted peptidase
MRAISAFFLLLISTGLVWGQNQEKKEPEKKGSEKKPSTTSRIEKKTYHFKEADKDMEYALFVPSTYDKEKKTPLVVALHGLFSTPQQMISYPIFGSQPKLTDQAEKYGFIVVAPMGYNTSGWYGSKGPKGGGKGVKDGKGTPENLGELSEKDVMNVLAIARKDYNIDSNRIYLMGHSMGGGGTMHLGLKYPEIWAALAPLAPAISSDIKDVAKIKHIPVLMIQGDKDALVPVAGPRRWAKAMKEEGVPLEYLEVEGGGHMDVAFDNMTKVFEFFSKQTKEKKDSEKKGTGKSTTSRIEKKTYFFKEADKDMEYALFVPSTYDKEKKTPLVVALHGLGGTPQNMIRYPELTNQAEKYGFIVVAPMGYNTGGWYGSKGPKGGGKGVKDGKGTPENLGELSEKDVMNVLDLIRKEYNVDSNRIYLMGHSMGGGGTVHLGLKYPEIWAALAPLAPAISSKIADLPKIKHIPVLMIQGDKDNLVPVAGPRRWAKEMKEQGINVEYVEVAGGGHVDVATKNMPRVFEFFSKQAKK